MMCRSPSSVSSACCRIKRLDEKNKANRRTSRRRRKLSLHDYGRREGAPSFFPPLQKHEEKNATREKTPTHTNTHCPAPSTPPTAEKRAME